MKLADGIHPAVHRDDYDRIERVNISSLVRIEQSPAHYKDGLEQKAEGEGRDTAALLMGRVTHTLVLEPRIVESAIAVWDKGRRSGKEWEAFKAKNQGRELVTDEEFETCQKMARKLLEDPQSRPYLEREGQREMTMLWTQPAGFASTPIRCRGRMDYVVPRFAITDIKTTRCAHPRLFGIQAAQLFYHVKGAWYADAWARLTGEDLPYVFISIESTRPFPVQVHRLKPEDMAKGRLLYRRWLDTLAFCLAENHWPAYREAECDLDLPPWAAPVDANDVLELADE